MTQSKMSQNKWNNIKCGFAKTGKESVKEKKLADIQARKLNFTSNLLNRGSDFLNSIIVKLMLHEIYQQSYILPDMSQLNPKYFWIWLTSLENTLMLIFKHKVKIFSILINFSSNGISHITLFDIWYRNNLILQKKL